MPRSSDQYRTPVREVTGSLRRKVFLVVVVIGIIPAALALAISYIAAFTSVVNMVREGSIGEATMLAQDFDARLARFAERFREGLGAEGIAPAVARVAEPEPQDEAAVRALWVPIATAIGELPVHILDSGGKPLAVLSRGKLNVPEQAGEDSARIDYGGAVARLRDGAAERVVTLAEERGPEGTPELWLIGRLLNSPAGAPLFAAVKLPLDRTIQNVETPPGSTEKRVLSIVSHRLGVVRAPAQDDSLDSMWKADPSSLFNERTGTVPKPGAEGLEFAYSRILTAAALSADSPRPVEWSVVQPVDLNDTLANLRHALWSVAVAGVVLLTGIAAFGFYAAERLVRPVHELTASVGRLASGELDHRVNVRTGDELEVLGSSVNQMAGTLAESYRRLAMKLLELDEKARQLALIHQIGKSINRSLDMEQLFRLFTSEVRDLIPIDRISLCLVSESGRDVELAHVFPPDRLILPKGARIPVANSYIGEGILTGAPGTHDLLGRKGGMEEERLLDATGMARLCVIPLNTANGTIGVLALSDADPNRFTPEEVETLSLIADTLALAVDHSRLFDRVKSFAAELERKVEERTRDLKSAQNQLIQAEKFAATGKIATDLAHEINNPLSIIKNYLAIVSSQLLRPQNSTADTEATRDGIRVIEEEIDRIARIVSQLRQLHAPQTQQLRDIDIAEELRAMSELFRATFSKRSIDLRLEADAGIGRVRLCGDHLRQILVNLLNNAADATEGGGSITVRAFVDPVRPRTFCVAVADTGTGIAEENLTRVFDPFFTTKKEGKGTGLGLSVSYSLAQRMGGALTCDSVMGKGTTMTIVLPLDPPPQAGDPSNGEAEDLEAIRRKGGKIYLG